MRSLLRGLGRRHRMSIALFVLIGLTMGGAPLYAQSGTATSSAIPSNATPGIGEQIEVDVSIDVTGLDAPDDALGSFTGTLDWDPAVLAYAGNSGVLAGFSGVVNDAQVSSGHLTFNGAKATGATGNLMVLSITFDVVGAGSTDLDLEYSAMSAAYTFRDLLPLLTVTDGHVQVAILVQYYSLTVAVDPIEGGATVPGVGVHAYPQGTVVDVTPVPDARYEFDHWSGACTGSGVCQVTMNADRAVTAYFAELPLTCFVLTLDHTGQGSDPVADPANSMDCPTGRYVEGETINLSGAVPGPGWRISGWTGTSHDDATTATNWLTMPASDDTASVVYELSVYLPIVGGDVASGETKSDPSPTWEETSEEEATTAEPTVMEGGEAIAPSQPGLGSEGVSGTLPKASTEQLAGERDSMGGSESSGEDDLMDVSNDSPVEGSSRVAEKLAYVLPILLVLGLPAFHILKNVVKSK